MFEPPNAVRVHVTLEEIEPPVWRRLVLPMVWNLAQLHLAIQAAFNWWNRHLHEFRIGGLRYGDPAHDDEAWEEDPRMFDEGEVRLRDFDGPGTSFLYVYDFGDNWRHVGRDREGSRARDRAPARDLHRRRSRLPRMSAASPATSSSSPSWPTWKTPSIPT